MHLSPLLAVLASASVCLAQELQAQAAGEWVESFRAPTGKQLQTTLQLYGTPAAMSDDGSVVAVGCQTSTAVWETRLFRDGPGGWKQETVVPASGFSTAVSGDGSRVALGDVYSSVQRGRVVVMGWDGSAWARVGNEITGSVDKCMSGYSVALSGDGNTLVVGSRQHPGGGVLRGRVEVFRLSADGKAWESALVQDGESDSFRLGHAVSINRAGDRVLASGGVDSGAGAVLTFALGADGGWSRADTVEPPITAGAGQTGFGSSLAVATDGSIAAVGAWKDVVDLPRGQNGRVSFHSPADPKSGPARPDITYGYANGMFGASVSVSGDAGVVAVGTNSFLGGVYTYRWDAQAGQWEALRHIPVSTATALGRSLALSQDGSRMLYLERASRQLVVVDFVPAAV